MCILLILINISYVPLTTGYVRSFPDQVFDFMRVIIKMVGLAQHGLVNLFVIWDSLGSMQRLMEATFRT